MRIKYVVAIAKGEIEDTLDSWVKTHVGNDLRTHSYPVGVRAFYMHNVSVGTPRVHRSTMRRS
jgi:hypothetical protein